MPGGFISGLLKGFGDRAAAERAISRKAQDEQDERENKILSTLAGSDDPEIAKAAITGMLQIAAGTKRPKGGFLGALMGPASATTHPAVSALYDLAQTPAPQPQTPVSAALVAENDPFSHLLPPPPQGAPRTPVTPPPSMPTGGVSAAPPAAAPPGSAAMAPVPTQGSMPISAAPQLPSPGSPQPSASAVASVGPPPLVTPASINQSPLPLGQHPGAQPAAGGPPPQPRKLFLTSIEKMMAGAVAAKRGAVQGTYQGWKDIGKTDEEARALTEDELIRQSGGGPSYRPLSYEAPDGKGGWAPIAVTFNNRTGDYEQLDGSPLPAGARPRTTAASSSAGADREALARSLYGGSFASLNQDQQKDVMAKALTYTQANAFQRGMGTGQAAAQAPLSTQNRFQGIRDLRAEWMKTNQPSVEMDRQLQLMQTGLKRFTEGDKIGGSQAVLVTFQKILDPSSVVRESEYARSPEGLSFLARVEGYFQRLKEGGAGVPVEELAQMVETARQFTQSMRDWNAAAKVTLEEQARQYGMDPTMVTGGTPGTAPPQMPQTVAPALPPAPAARGGGVTPPPAVPTTSLDADEYDQRFGLFEKADAPGVVYGRKPDGSLAPVEPYLNSRNQTSYRFVKK